MEYLTDDERVEELKKWWKENGKSILLGVALGLSILYGWRWWVDYKNNQSIQASVIFMQAEQALRENKTEEVQAAADKIMKEFDGTPYAVDTALLLAKQKIENGKLGEAKTQLQWAYDHAKTPEMKQLSRIRLARIMVTLGEDDAALKLITTADAGSFLAAYEELKGDIYHKQGKDDLAREAYLKARESLGNTVQGNPTLLLKLDDIAVADTSQGVK